MSRPLLPSNATQLERLAGQALAQIERVPVPIRDLISPTRCPVALLPYLAWAMSVDRWEESWPEATKRQVIASSYYVHAHKGTIGAIRRALTPLGNLTRIIEWWQTEPLGTAGTFALEIEVSKRGISEETFAAIELMVGQNKPVSRHVSNIALVLSISAPVYAGAAHTGGDDLTVLPYSPEPLEVTMLTQLGGTAHIIDEVDINHVD